MNSICLVGRIGQDLELKHTQSGKEVVSFSLAVRRDKDTTDWLDCVAWGKTAQLIADYFKKGSTIGITGRLQSRTWEDKEGKKRKAVEVFVSGITFCDSGEAKQGAKQEPKAQPQGEFVPVGDDDELPF